MEKEFVSYEQAVALKELGFDEECLRIWKKQIPFNSFDIQDFKIVGSERCILSPLKQQVFRLFREKYNYWSYVYPYIHDKTWHFHVQFYDSDMWGEVFLGNNYSNYEEAENACIDKLIELAKQHHED
jgi:hypothetical protein